MQNRCISNTSRATARSIRLARAIALTLACAATPAAWSQRRRPEGELEEIVVTGFRASLAESLEIKRTTATAVDTILAEDIADFPDLNLAESLQRIPGVSIARDAGEGRQITVRGLGPQFTRVRINGMEALSTAGGTDATGGTNRSRSFDFNVFASELFNSAVGAQDRVGRDRGRLARRHGGPACGAALRLQRHDVRHVGAGRLQRPERRVRSACLGAAQQRLCRRPLRRAGVGGLHRAHVERRRLEHGALAEGRWLSPPWRPATRGRHCRS